MNRPIDVPLVGDLRAVVPQLVAALKDSPRKPSADLDRWIKEDADRLANSGRNRAQSGKKPMHTARFVVEATKAFPKDGIMVRDGGATVIFQWTYSQCKPHDVIWNQNFGHIGTGLPYAIGASVADGRKRPVMLLTSDSSFMFHIAELETACRLKLPLVCVVGVDNQWGLEVGVYKRTFGQGIVGNRGALEQGGAASTRSPRASAATANMSTARRGDRAGDQARLCQRQAERHSRPDRPEGEFGRNAEL